MSKKITLVLGAGASVFMGYPTGAQLRRELIGDRTINLVCEATKTVEEEVVREFVAVFRASQMYSIDAFLARRPEYSDIGKLAIAAVLISREKPSSILDNEHDDNWYRYFFNEISSESWDELDLSRFSIVTFNYDRSFEHYMLTAIRSSYGKSADEAERKLKEMKIIHVYGSIGAIYPSERDYYAYRPELEHGRLVAAASRLKVIPEGRQDEPALEAARAALSESDKIAFLGFGYDETNLHRLNSNNTCQRRKQTQSGILIRPIQGTCLGMTEAEKARAMLRICRNSETNRAIQMFNMNCHQFLRECLILE